MKLENAKITDLQKGDVIDLHGLEVEGIQKYIHFKGGFTLRRNSIESVAKSITIHRKTPKEKALEDAQKAIEALNALGGNYQLVEASKAETPWTPERLEGFGEWIDWHGGECPVDGDVMVEFTLRSGYIETRKAKKLGWEHGEFFPSSDIIKYRII